MTDTVKIFIGIFFKHNFSQIATVSSCFSYRLDLEKQGGCGVVAHERLTEPDFSILPVF